MELSHKLLHSQKIFFVLKTQPPGDFFLKFKNQAIVFSSGQQVKMIADQGDEIQVLFKFLIFDVREFAHVLQVLRDPQSEKDPRKPKYVMVVPQPAYALLEIRLEQMACIPGCGGIMNARAIARHYAMLAGHGVLDGTRILSEAQVDLIRALQTDAPDEVYGVQIPKSLGYFLGGAVNQEWSRAMGRSGMEFGHPGLGGSLGFTDPEKGLGFGLTKNLMKADDKTACVIAEDIRAYLNTSH